MPAASSRNFDPVTVSVAPRNVSRIRQEYRGVWGSRCLSPIFVMITAMDEQRITTLVAELQRSAEEKFGRERAEEMRNDLVQLARELDSLNTYPVRFEDEP